MRRWIVFVLLALGVPVLGGGQALEAQEADLGLRQTRGEIRSDLGFPLNIAPVRERGQPVIPIFEGWVPNSDGTITLSFEYFNLNSAESLDIPLGPDNFIEPREFDGAQPTHFHPAPTCCNRRHLSSFTVRVPAGFEGDVVWTLTSRGQTYSVPGHALHEAYRMDNLEAFTISPVAPELRFDPDPNGPTAIGRSSLTHGPLNATVGEPLPLSVWVDPQPASATMVVGSYAGDQMAVRVRNILQWFHHQGPGEVTFSRPETVSEAGPAEVTTTATFSEPGEYVLQLWAIENFRAVDQHCCWTTAYVRVNVTP